MLISFKVTTNQVCSWLTIQCVFLKVIQVFVKKVATLIKFGDLKNNIKNKENIRTYFVTVETIPNFLGNKSFDST